MLRDSGRLEVIFEEPDRRPWPWHGGKYPVIFEVEHIGLFWEDTPAVKALVAPAEVRGVLSDHSLREMCEHFDDERAGECLPIASGVYEAVLEFWFFDGHDPEGTYDCEYGFNVLKLRRLRDVKEVT